MQTGTINSGMTDMFEPVYVILVNYGNWKDTYECMKSLESFAERSVTVIIVDIENLGGSLEKLQEGAAPLSGNRYRILEETVNRGFAHACNRGIKLALEEDPGCFIWLLNNDTLVGPGSLAGLIACYRDAAEEGDRKPGFVGSLVVDPGHDSRIQFAGGILDLARARLIVQGEGELLAQYPGQNRCSRTEWVMGASMFFHSSLISSIGFMPEDYFLYYEDVEWSLRALNQGHVNLVSRESIIIHKQGSSTGQDYNKGKRVDPVTTWHFYRSYLLFFKKNYPQKIRLARAILLKQMAGKLVRGDLKRFSIILKVLLGSGPDKTE